MDGKHGDNMQIEIDLTKIERGTHEGRVKVTRGGKTFWRKQRVGQKEPEKKETQKLISEGWDTFYLQSGQTKKQISEKEAFDFVGDQVIADLTGKKMSEKKLNEYAKEHNFLSGWVDNAYREIKEPRSIESIERDIKRAEDQAFKRVQSSRSQGGSQAGGGAMDRDLQRIWEKSRNFKDELDAAKKFNR